MLTKHTVHTYTRRLVGAYHPSTVVTRKYATSPTEIFDILPTSDAHWALSNSTANTRTLGVAEHYV